MTTLADLRVVVRFSEGVYESRPATVQDWVDVGRELGAEEVEADTCDDQHVSCTTLEMFDVSPGRYLVYRLEDR